MRKALSDRVGVIYGVEHTQAEQDQSGTIRQRVGADVEVTETDSLSVEAESEVPLPNAQKPVIAPEPEKNEKVLLKYRKKF